MNVLEDPSPLILVEKSIFQSGSFLGTPHSSWGLSDHGLYHQINVPTCLRWESHEMVLCGPYNSSLIQIL